MGNSPSKTITSPPKSVAVIRVFAKEHVYHISFELTSGEVFSSGGSYGGDEKPPFVLENEYVTQINYYQGEHLHAIQFVTNTERMSDMYGMRPNADGLPLTYYSPIGTSIVGLCRGDGYCAPITSFKKYRLPSSTMTNFFNDDDDSNTEMPVPIPHEFNVRYQIAEYLGKDAFSMVKAAIDKRTNLKVAVKCIKRSNIPKLAEDPIRQEYELLKLASHPGLVRSFDFFENDRFFHHIFELCKGGDLLERMHDKRKYNEMEAKALIINLLSAVKCLHDNGIAHRDIKPENILLHSVDDDVKVKLTNLSCASISGYDNVLTSLCITPMYSAPEALTGKAKFDTPADMWSIGVLTYLLLTGISPFADRNSDEALAKICSAQYIFYTKYFEDISLAAQDFISKLLVVKPALRLTAEQALLHPWIVHSPEELAGMPHLFAKPSPTSDEDSMLIPEEYDDRFVQQHLLEKGTYYEMFLAKEKGTNNYVSLKVVCRGNASAVDRAIVKQESLIHRKLSHTNITKYLGFWKDKYNYYLATEWPAGGELYERVHQKITYSENEARKLLHSLLSAVKYLHDEGIVHRDIRLENILLVSKDNDTEVKLTEFKAAGRDRGENQLTRSVANNFFVAPEVVKNWRYGPAIDLWAVGAVAYCLMGGYPPFHEDNPRDHFSRIVRVHYEFHSQYWTAVSEMAKDFISRLMTANPVDRMTADEALAHPWMLQESTATSAGDTTDHLGHRRKFRAAGRAVMFYNLLLHQEENYQCQTGLPDTSAQLLTLTPEKLVHDGDIVGDDGGSIAHDVEGVVAERLAEVVVIESSVTEAAVASPEPVAEALPPVPPN